VSERRGHSQGLTGLSREMPGVATAVKSYGKRYSGEEARLELLARIGAQDRGSRSGLRVQDRGSRSGLARSGLAAANLLSGLGTNALLRIRRIGGRP
jgi:hypothetical protein